MTGRKLTIEAELEHLQRDSFSDVVHEANPDNGLVIENCRSDLSWQLM